MRLAHQTPVQDEAREDPVREEELPEPLFADLADVLVAVHQNHTADLVRDVAAGGRPMVITQNGEAKVVVMDVSAYDCASAPALRRGRMPR